MGLNVGNSPVKQVYVGSTPVTAVHVGAQKVWPVGPRTVTIRAGGVGASFEGSPTGDVSLIGGWVDNGGELGASFVAPVTCNRDVRSLSNFLTIRVGSTIPAGQGVSPTYGSKEPPYVFTEVL